MATSDLKSDDEMGVISDSDSDEKNWIPIKGLLWLLLKIGSSLIKIGPFLIKIGTFLMRKAN